MLTYENLKEKPKEFLVATGLTATEFDLILPVFHAKYAGLFEPGMTRKGKPRQRREGCGVKEKLRVDEDKLLFILVYQKTYPLQTMHRPQKTQKSKKSTTAARKKHIRTKIFCSRMPILEKWSI